ncbi:MAG: transcriptional regulator PpsR [Betaproteobacteria bacterium]
MADKLFVGDLDPKAAVRLVESTSDLVLLLDAAGCVLKVAVHDGNLAGLGVATWVGRPWIDTVTVESREKIVASLSDAAQATPSRWRQVNHPVPGGDDLLVQYVTMAAQGESAGAACTVAFGRDLRSTVALQRRLVEAQQTMERDYWRFREADTRYRHLLQTSHEPLLVVDGKNQRVVEANPAAEALVAKSRGGVVGMGLSALFDEASAEPLQSLLAAARAVGKRDPVRLGLAEDGAQAWVSATLFRQDQMPYLLLRVVPVAKMAQTHAAAQAAGPSVQGLYQAYVGQASDGLVFTDAQGRVLSANRTFALMAQLSAEEQARGEMLDRWLGRTGVELSVLVTNLRQRGSVGLFTTALRGEFGAQIEVEISASVMTMPDGPRLGFAIRDISRRLQGEERTPDRVSRSVSELTELVGRVPLKDIVSETTELIEQLCIEAALQMTHGNRASAAQLLGLSRQSLYVKLNRFGMGGQGGSDTDDERPAVNID